MAADQFAIDLGDGGNRQYHAFNATYPPHRVDWAEQAGKVYQNFNQPTVVPQRFQQSFVFSNAGPLVPRFQQQPLQPQLPYHQPPPPPAPITLPISAPAYPHQNQQYNHQYNHQYNQHHLQQAPPPGHHTSQQQNQHQQPRRNLRVPDGKILILFDLNGVLTDHTPARQEGKYIVRDHVIRPQIEVLLRLLPHFTLGIYSSATRKTVNTALGIMHRKMRDAAATNGVDGLVVPPMQMIFPIICDRSSCQSDPHWQTRTDGKEWDTIKPLGLQGFDLRRTILVDNDHYKSAEGEADNMFLMPHWEQDPVSDRDLPILVELLLQRLKLEMGDVRPHLEPMRQTLMQLRQAPQQQQQQQDSEQMQQSQEAQRGAGGDAMVEQPEQQSAQAAAAAPMVNAPPAKLNKMEKAALDRTLAYKGFQAGALELGAAPTKVQQLIQVLTQYAAIDATTAAGSSSSSTVVDISKLLSVFASDGSSSSQALLAAASATYQQHVANVLLAAVWAAGFCVPDGYTMEQLLQTLSSKGFPTDYADRMCDILLRKGDLVVYEPQQQQLRFTWPLHPGHWPISSGSAAAASGSSLMSFPMFHRRLKNIPKAADAVRALLDQGPAAVEAVLTGYGTKPLEPGDDGYSAAPQQQAAAAAGSDDDDEQQPGAAGVQGQWASARKVAQHNPLLQEWKVVLKVGFKDLSSRRGVLLEQLLMFIQGCRPEIAQQLMGDSTQQQQQQQQQQRLKCLLEHLAGQQTRHTLLQPTLASQIQCDAALGLLIEPQTADHCWKQPIMLAAASVRQQQQGILNSPLTRYFCSVVPEPAAVAHSFQVLSHAAAAASAQQQQQPGSQVLLNQLWQQLLLPAAPAIPEVPVFASHLANRIREVVQVMNVPPDSQMLLMQELRLQVMRTTSAGAEEQEAKRERRKRKRGKALVKEWDEKLQELEQQQAPQQQQQQPADDSDGGGLLALLPELPASHQQQQLGFGEGSMQQEQQMGFEQFLGKQHHQLQNSHCTVKLSQQQQLGFGEGSMQRHQQMGFGQASSKQEQQLQNSDPAAKLSQQQQQQQQQLGFGQDVDDSPELRRRTRQRRIEQQPGLASEYWLDQQYPAAAAAAAGNTPAAAAAAAAAAQDHQDFEGGMAMEVDGSYPAAGLDGSSGDEELVPVSNDGNSSDGDDDDDLNDLDLSGNDDEDDQDHDDGSEGDLITEEDQGLGGLTDEEGFDQALNDAEAVLGDLGDADKGLANDAEAALDDLYTADELALAQGRGEDEEAGWVTDDECDGGDGFDDNAQDGQLQLGITSMEDDAVEEDAAAAAAAAKKQKAKAQVPGGRPLHDELVAAAAAAAGVNTVQQQQGESSGGSSRKSALHHELLVFAAAAAPSAVERLVLECALNQLQQVAQQIWLTAEAVLFGSQATGLALPGSDLDVVLLGTPCPKTKSAAEGYHVKDRITVKKMLYRLQKALCKQEFADQSELQIIDARVPLCKGPMSFMIPQSDLAAAIAQDDATGATMHCPVLARVARDAVPCIGSKRASGCVEVVLPVDLSLGVANGAAAVSFMTKQVLALPPLRPLVLVVKALLKEAGLNEVFTGGLSSYSLVNMVVAHLQAEGMRAARMTSVPVMGQEQVQQHLTQLAAAAAAAAGSNALPQQQWDLGCLLHGFFLRYGEVFSYQSEAVSVRAGGIIAKRPQWKMPAPKDALLAVEDPQQYGRDIASASRAITEVKGAFAWAADSLKRMVQYFEGTEEGRQQLAAAAEQLLRKDTAAAAAAAGSSASAARQSAGLTGLTEAEMWAAVQAEGQSVSVPDTVVQQYQQQQQGQQQQQQQYQAGYVMLPNLIDVFAALGRGPAADARRQQLVDAAEAARNARGQQQMQHVQQRGVRVKSAAAKSSLKIAGLDRHAHNSNAAAAAAAAPAAAAGVRDGNAPRIQQLLDLFSDTLQAVAAAEAANGRGEVADGVHYSHIAVNCFAESIEPALAAAAAATGGSNADDLLMLMCTHVVSIKIRCVTEQLIKAAEQHLSAADGEGQPRRAAAPASSGSSAAGAVAAATMATAAAQVCQPAPGGGSAELGGSPSAAAAAAAAAAATANAEQAEFWVQQLRAVQQGVGQSLKPVKPHMKQARVRAAQVYAGEDQSEGQAKGQQKQSVFPREERMSHDLVRQAFIVAARAAGITDIKLVQKAIRVEEKAAAKLQQQGAPGSNRASRRKMAREERNRRMEAAGVDETLKPRQDKRLTKRQRKSQQQDLNRASPRASGRKRPKRGAAGQQQGSPGGGKRQRRSSAAARGGGGRGWSHE